jgi:hypothetical protein
VVPARDGQPHFKADVGVRGRLDRAGDPAVLRQVDGLSLLPRPG